MNILLILGLLLIVAYILGYVLEVRGIPKIIGYILTGIIFSPNTVDWIPDQVIINTGSLLAVSLAFIAFEVGGELKWSTIKKQEKEIVGITFLAGLIPLILITSFFYFVFILFPTISPFATHESMLAFSLLVAALASPTDPAAMLAIVHQYKAKGSVKNTILGVAALDDALGIIIFSIAIAVASFLLGQSEGLGTTIQFVAKHIIGGIIVGAIAAFILQQFLKYLPKSSEGQWIVIIFSLIILCYGAATIVGADEILACMVMGILLVNTCKHQRMVFKILERYTEELIFLFFFVLSGLHLNIHAVPEALLPIFLYVTLRIVGKYTGSYLGATLVNADKKIRKYTAGGLIPQGGIVIGLALVLNHYTVFADFFDMLLAVVMGATLVNELIGPIMVKRSLERSQEISSE